MHSASRVISRSSICSSVAVSGMVSSFVMALCLQVAVHEVDLLQAAKALADVLRPDLSDALHRLQFRVAGGEDLVEPPELAHDVLDHQLRQPRDAAEDAVAARGHGEVERVDLAVVAEELGEAPEVEQVLVGQAGDAVEG